MSCYNKKALSRSNILVKASVGVGLLCRFHAYIERVFEGRATKEIIEEIFFDI